MLSYTCFFHLIVCFLSWAVTSTARVLSRGSWGLRKVKKETDTKTLSKAGTRWNAALGWRDSDPELVQRIYYIQHDTRKFY